MKATELKAKNVEELETILLNSKKELFNLRFQKRTGALENTSRIRQVRRTVARIYTIMPLLKSGQVSTLGKASKKPTKEKAKTESKLETKSAEKAKAKKPAKKAKDK